MPAPFNLMGYHLQLFYGTAGSTATTRDERVLDITHNIDVSYGSTKVRGDGSAVPIAYEKATERKPTLSFSKDNDPNDAALALYKAAAQAGGAMSFVLKERNSAGVETIILNADFNIKQSKKDPVGGESSFDYECTPTRDYGRNVAYA